jgi:hypothetical protein
MANGVAAVNYACCHTPVSLRYTGYQLPAYPQKIQTCAKISDFQIEIELLISLIEARPILWNKARDIYKDRDGTRKVWKEVCEGIKESSVERRRIYYY